MKVFKIPITVKEANFHLDREVKRLLDIHVKVSNPDFEEALVKSTGIGWKQVKNYKNHPRPYQVIKDNAKVLEFVERSRNLDKYFKFKLMAFMAPIIAMVILSGYGFFIYVSNQVPKTYLVVTKKNEFAPIKFNRNHIISTVLEIPNSNIKLQLGKIQNSKINLKEFNCQSSEMAESYRCEKNFLPNSTLVLMLNHDFIFRFHYIYKNKGDVPIEIINYLKTLKARYKLVANLKYENEAEEIEVVQNVGPEFEENLVSIYVNLKEK